MVSGQRYTKQSDQISYIALCLSSNTESKSLSALGYPFPPRTTHSVIVLGDDVSLINKAVEVLVIQERLLTWPIIETHITLQILFHQAFGPNLAFIQQP